MKRYDRKPCFTLSAKAAAFVFVIGVVVTNSVGAAVTTVGIYDENITDENTTLVGIQNNVVDVSATLDVNPNQISLTTFTTNLQTAFANNLGGVINFDNGTISTGFGTSSITASYGASQAKSITIGAASTTSFALQSSLTSRMGISHPGDNQTGNQLGLNAGPSGSSNSEDFTFNFLTADKVVQAGGTLLSRSGSVNVTLVATATFSDGTTSSVTFTSSGTDATGGGQNDTFAGFVAPTGLFVTQLKFDNLNTSGSFRSLDDLGFIVVPEPSSAVLLGGLGTLLLMRRRRHHG